MKIRMLFGTILPPTTEDEDPQDLRCGSTQDIPNKVALQLIGDGRAEPVDPKDTVYQAWLKKIQPAETPAGDGTPQA